MDQKTEIKLLENASERVHFFIMFLDLVEHETCETKKAFTMRVEVKKFY